jgi:hypothetical protein
MNQLNSFIRLRTIKHTDKVSELTLDFGDSIYMLNNLGLKFIHDYWVHYISNNNINSKLYGIFDNSRVVVDILKQDIYLFKTILLMVSTHPHFIKQRNNFRCSNCNACKQDKGFSFYKRFKNVR